MPQLDAPEQLLPSGALLESAAQAEPPLPPNLATVLAAIGSEPVKFDTLVQQVAKPTSEILGSLTQLELMDLVTKLPGDRYQRR
jgi:DNA processing protein